MTDKAGVKRAVELGENKASPGGSADDRDDKLLLLLMAGLAGVLVVALLVWRAVNKEADAELIPTAEQKHAIWFDKDGVVRKSRAQAEMADGLAATTPALVALEGNNVTTTAGESSVSSAPKAAPKASGQTRAPDYWIQLASFSQLANAEALRDSVAAGSSVIEIARNQVGGKTVYAVRVVVYGDRAKAEKLARQIAKKHGLQPLVMTPR